MDQHGSHGAPRQNWSGLVFLGFAVIAAFLLFSEHRAHLFGALPYLLLLACPILHLFHHGGHGRHGGGDDGDKKNTSGHQH
jgi:hypothetical protein